MVFFLLKIQPISVCDVEWNFRNTIKLLISTTRSIVQHDLYETGFLHPF